MRRSLDNSLKVAMSASCVNLFFFFQAEDGIRDLTVTGVQTCALPISAAPRRRAGPGSGPPGGGSCRRRRRGRRGRSGTAGRANPSPASPGRGRGRRSRSEERREGKRVDLGGRRIIKKKKKDAENETNT